MDTSNSAQILDLLAPGRWISSTVPGGTFEGKSGTSMAAPHVAGAIVVLRDAEPNATVDDMVAVLKCTGVSIRDGKNGIVKPRIQLDMAVELLRETRSGVIYLDPDNGNDSNNGIFSQAVQSLSRAAALVPNDGIILTEPATFRNPITLDEPMTICNTAGGAARTPSSSSGSSGTSSTPNQTPVALTDEAEAISGESVVIHVLSNDTDADNHSLTITSVQEPPHGHAITDESTVVYTSTVDFAGLEEFAYTISDGNGGFASGTIKVAVRRPVPKLVANSDFYVVNQNAATTLDVLFNDTNPNDDVLTISTVSEPLNGAATASSTAILYTPNADFLGLDTFTYLVSNSSGETSTAAVTVSVAEPTQPSLLVLTTTLTFTGTQGKVNSPDQTFTIENAGTGALNWTANESIAWLTLSEMAGTAPSTITVSIDSAGLAPGDYTGEIQITAGDQTERVTVNLTVEPASSYPVYLPLIKR